MTYINDIYNAIVSNQGLILLAILASLVVVYAKKNGKLPAQVVEIAIDTFEFIEDNYVAWGIRENDKLDVFLKEFIKRYRDNNEGQVPTGEIITLVMQLVENLVANQNKDKVDPADIQ